jgi:vacuolar-type H+-ATPase subunit I/STV1
MDQVKRRNLIIITVISTIIIALGFTTFYFMHKANQKEAEMAEVVQMMNFEKEQVQKEYANLNEEFNVGTSNIKNDSLVQLLQDQKTKVQQLLEELRITKSTNSKRIAQLRQELASVRQVMIQYVNQIDSLNSVNKVLKTENVEVHKKYQAATETVKELYKEKASLNQAVTRASILEVTDFKMTPLNNSGKKTGWFAQTATLQFNYTISKNITSQPGEKTIYLRITRPDDDILTKSQNNFFQFENKKINYSCSKKIEYTGEAINDVIYWKVSEILPKGNYRAEFFIDGNRVGSFTFVFEK